MYDCMILSPIKSATFFKIPCPEKIHRMEHRAPGFI